MAEATETGPVRAARATAASASTPVQQRALQMTAARGSRIRRTTRDAERQIRALGRSDRARTSLEYHEWKHNCIAPGENFKVLQGTVLSSVNLDIAYSLTDGPQVDGTYRPPYYQWIKHEELRTVANLVKRFRRYWRGKNMPLLRAELGFANVEDAIQASLAESTDYTDARTILVATPDFE
jgi:hypothetical protein